MPKQRKLTNGFAKGYPVVILAADGSRVETKMAELGQIGFKVCGAVSMFLWSDENKTWARP